MAFKNLWKNLKTGVGVASDKAVDFTKGLGTASAQDALLKGLKGRLEPKKISGKKPLTEQLKNQPWFQSKTPSLKTTEVMEKRIESPVKKITPTIASGKDVSGKLSDKFSDKIVDETPVREKEAITAPPSKTAPQVWKAGGEVITRRGVYSRSKTAEGGSRLVFKRKNEPGDILGGKEIYTHRKEWRPLSSEHLAGKGELLFTKPNMLKKLKERV